MSTASKDSSAEKAAADEPVNPGLTLALTQASLAAYDDYEGKPFKWPTNYRPVARWTGWDASIFGGQEERFGLLFRSTLLGPQQSFIFAFRGTDSDLDAWEDAWFNTVPFSPYQGTVSPTPYVSSGFYGIYNGIGGTMKQSMRQQVFSLLAGAESARVYVTGHSLGGALSQLFTLDVAVSAPKVWFANMNFASPMVGTADWQVAYESQAAQKDPERKTVRVFNYWDWAPSLPPALFNYTHVGRPFRTSFYARDVWLPYLLARHSILNLQVVLENAVRLRPQVWTGTFQDRSVPNSPVIMQSDAPPAGAEARWVEKARELQQFERSLREGAGPAAAQAHTR